MKVWKTAFLNWPASSFLGEPTWSEGRFWLDTKDFTLLDALTVSSSSKEVHNVYVFYFPEQALAHPKIVKLIEI